MECLLAVKHALNVTPDSLWDWIPGAPSPCNWYGVTCSNNNSGSGPGGAAVVGIQLWGLETEQAGAISPRLTGLSKLRQLRLSDMNLEGDIPDLSPLMELEELDLSGNRLQGPLPAWLPELTRLRHLDLSDNQLSGGALGPGVGNLSGLRHLGLASCGLRGPLPPQLWSLRNLTYLDVGGVGNQVAGDVAAEQVWGMTRLTHLHLGACRPSSLAGLLDLTSLTSLAVVVVGDGAGGAGGGWDAGGSVPDDYSLPAELGRRLPLLESLVLEGVGLTGPLPESLGLLSALRVLSLGGNRLSGPVPASLGRCAQLILLNLASNRLSGPIPAALAGLVRLRTLSLVDNALSGGVPDWLHRLPALQAALLSRNALQGELPAPELLLGGPELATLALDDNALTGGIPADLCRSRATGGGGGGGGRALRDLDLGHNRLTGALGDAFRGCGANLSRLQLQGNLLTGAIPGYLLSPVDMPQLRILGLEGNRLTGRLPQQLWANAVLQELAAGGNRLHGPLFFDDAAAGDAGRAAVIIISASSLQYLKLEGNRLDGALPARGLANLTSLAWLELQGNRLTGSIPAELADCAQLSTLNLAGNGLAGGIPPHLGRLRYLDHLDLSRNNLSGGIPPDLCAAAFHQPPAPDAAASPQQQVTYLQHRGRLDLSWNRLSGGIPPALANCSLLVDLLLAGNQLTGVIPGAHLARRLPNLTTLDLSHNLLTGGVPPGLAAAGRLQGLHLAGNRLTGPVPADLGELRALALLNLSHNALEGAVPPELGRLTNLYKLDLSGNRLSGGLPPALADLLQLSVLALADNRLTGAISPLLSLPQAALWRQMAVLDLSGNAFTGPVPLPLANVTGLASLDLHANRLTGRIPRDLAQLAQLTYLDVSANRLEGAFPPDLCALRHLRLLNVSHNQLTGAASSSCHRFWPAAFVDNPGLCYLSGSSCQEGAGGGGASNGSQAPSDNRPLLPTGRLLALCMGAAIACLCVALLLRWWLLLRTQRQQQQQQDKLHLNLYNNKEDDDDDGDGDQETGEQKEGGSIGKPRHCSKLKWNKKKKKRNKAGHIQNTTTTNHNSNKRGHLGHMKDQEPLSINVAMFERPLVRLSLADILHATNGFCKANIIGDGGFGTVYKAVLPPDGRTVAIKKLAYVRDHEQEGTRHFVAEMETLGKVKHPNLVPLLGYCSLGHHKLLVYDYMENGSLDLWLRAPGPDRHTTVRVATTVAATTTPTATATTATPHPPHPPHANKLDWPTRLRIAQGAARGLAFLHHAFVPHIIHRDVKASNILLDHQFEPRVADFGLARLISAYDTHVTTDVAGTFGYIPPEYGHTCHCTTRGDVYSFGVILLELVTGREPTGLHFRDDVHGGNLVGWARHMLANGLASQALDPALLPHPHSMLTVLHIAHLCTAMHPAARPTMLQVVNLLNRITT